MAHIIKLKTRHTIQELRQILKTVKDETQKTRIRAIIGIQEGKTRTEISNDLVVERGTIIDWIHIYNQKGIDGLAVNKGGRKEGNPKWDAAIFNELIKEIDKQEQYWSIPKMVEWIEKRFKKEIPEQTIWYQLDKRGYSYKSSRPSPYLGNKEKQESFKKGAWVKS
jgi:transposase